jgi:hypothetical protein
MKMLIINQYHRETLGPVTSHYMSFNLKAIYLLNKSCELRIVTSRFCFLCEGEGIKLNSRVVC